MQASEPDPWQLLPHGSSRKSQVMVGLRLGSLQDEWQVLSGYELHAPFEHSYDCGGELHIRECEGTPYNHPRLLMHRRSLSHERIRPRNFSILSPPFTILIDNNT